MYLNSSAAYFRTFRVDIQHRNCYKRSKFICGRRIKICIKNLLRVFVVEWSDKFLITRLRHAAVILRWVHMDIHVDVHAGAGWRHGSRNEHGLSGRTTHTVGHPRLLDYETSRLLLLRNEFEISAKIWIEIRRSRLEKSVRILLHRRH